MAAAAVHSPTEAPVADPASDATDSPPAEESPFGGFYSPDQLFYHPNAADILRQIEFYFSDENLSQDPHLLALTGGDGNGAVRLSDILSFPKMRKFKSPSKVKETIRQSYFLEVSKDSKYIKRKYPLTRRITVIPKFSEDRIRKTVPNDKPWLTKNMLKPTGFEPNATNGPISPEQYEKDVEKYDPEANSIISRFETAVACFNANRKMHQTTRHIFEGFMLLGGFEGQTHMFQGGVQQERKRLAEDGFDKEDILQMTAHYGFSEHVKDAIFGEMEGKGKSKWVVDFEALAGAYLSTVFMQNFDWYEASLVNAATNVLRNFYHYLSYHSVCPEYADGLNAARELCNAAEEELPKLATVDQSLPGAFNSACSTLFEGTYADVHLSQDAQSGWAHGGDNIGLSRDEAVNIFKAGIAAYCTDEQYEKANTALSGGEIKLKVISQETMGVEIVSVELPSEETKAMYALLREREGWSKYIHPMGKLYCKRWDVPSAPPCDLPNNLTSAAGRSEEITFLIEEETLKFCQPGMKMEAAIMELDLGIKFIDSIDQMWPSFYTWLPNEKVLDWKEPADPKGWMKRQTAKKDGVKVTGEDAAAPALAEDEEAEFSDEGPD